MHLAAAGLWRRWREVCTSAARMHATQIRRDTCHSMLLVRRWREEVAHLGCIRGPCQMTCSAGTTMGCQRMCSIAAFPVEGKDPAHAAWPDAMVCESGRWWSRLLCQPALQDACQLRSNCPAFQYRRAAQARVSCVAHQCRVSLSGPRFRLVLAAPEAWTGGVQA